MLCLNRFNINYRSDLFGKLNQMNPKILAVAAFIITASICYILVFVLYVARRGNNNRCTQRTNGVIIGPSAINYAGHHIPLVQYEVGGITYKTAGPKFESGTATPGAQCNILDASNPPKRLVVPSMPIIANRIQVDELYRMSPLSKIYPVGSQIVVWYNPANPRNAYVLRPVREGVFALKVLLPLAIVFSVAAVVAAFLV